MREGWRRFYVVIRRIPRGRVSTYAQVAAVAGNPRLARHVGFALAALKETEEPHDVPWQRVLGARPRGRAQISIKDPVGAALQRELLLREGVELDGRDRVELAKYGWRPRVRKLAPAARNSVHKRRS